MRASVLACLASNSLKRYCVCADVCSTESTLPSTHSMRATTSGEYQWHVPLPLRLVLSILSQPELERNSSIMRRGPSLEKWWLVVDPAKFLGCRPLLLMLAPPANPQQPHGPYRAPRRRLATPNGLRARPLRGWRRPRHEDH